MKKEDDLDEKEGIKNYHELALSAGRNITEDEAKIEFELMKKICQSFKRTNLD